jgi:acetyl esterase/lipase
VGNTPSDPEIEVQLGVEYANHDGVALLGDLYMPAAPGAYPAMLLIHGGAWLRGSRTAYQYWGPYLARHGYVAFAVGYRLASPGQPMYPQNVHDVKAAVQYLRGGGAAIKVDPDRLGAMGDSVGGYFASLLALSGDSPKLGNPHTGDAHYGVSTRLKVAVPVYGWFDLLQVWEHNLVTRPLDAITETYLGVSPMENRDIYYEASPIRWTTIQNNRDDFLVVWGTADDIADHLTQSIPFVTALKRAGTYTRTVPIEGAPHFWISDPIDEPQSYAGFLAPKLLRFLRERL